VMTIKALEHLADYKFHIMWTDIIDNRTYNIILTDPENAEYYRDEKMRMGYYTFKVRAYEDIEELSIRKGESFIMYFPIRSFGLKLLQRITFKKILKVPVLLSFIRHNHKRIEFEVCKLP